jgi:hypothetical protein
VPALQVPVLLIAGVVAAVLTVVSVRFVVRAFPRASADTRHGLIRGTAGPDPAQIKCASDHSRQGSDIEFGEKQSSSG